jgi:hypothetical protein
LDVFPARLIVIPPTPKLSRVTFPETVKVFEGSGSPPDIPQEKLDKNPRAQKSTHRRLVKDHGFFIFATPFGAYIEGFIIKCKVTK